MALEGAGVQCCSVEAGTSNTPYFLQKKYMTIIATNVLSRGVNVDASIAINFDIPDQATFYANRSSCVSHFGRQGLVISLIDPESLKLLERHAQKLNFGLREI